MSVELQPTPTPLPAGRLPDDLLLLRRAVGRQATRICVLSALALVAGMVLGVALCQFLVREQMQLQAGAVAQLQNEIRGLTGDIQRLETATAGQLRRVIASSTPHHTTPVQTSGSNSLTDPPPGFVSQISSTPVQRSTAQQTATPPPPAISSAPAEVVAAESGAPDLAVAPCTELSAEPPAQRIVRRGGAVSPAALNSRNPRGGVTLTAAAETETGPTASRAAVDECPAMPGAAHLIPLPETALPPARAVVTAAPRPSPRPALLSFASGRRVADSTGVTPSTNAPSPAASSGRSMLR